MYKVAVVNSKTFGEKNPEALGILERYAKIERLSVGKNLCGKVLAEMLKGYHFIIASSTPKYDKEFFANNKDILLLAEHGIGTDNIDLEAATENGVLVTRVPGYREREAVAELAVALTLSAARYICNASNAVRDGKWGDRGKFVGLEVKGKKVGVIGLGNIGGRVAEIFSNGFNAKVLAYDPYVNKEEAERHGAHLVDLETLLKECDIITLHLPLTNETYHMIDEKEFKMMKQNVILVNTARGGLICTQALIENLRNRKLGYVALDVIEGEPIKGDHPILDFENVIVVPHIGAYTIEALYGMDESCVQSIISTIEGKVPPGLVNQEVLKKGFIRAKIVT
ncbi:TPA: hydroxyacid dehydrogenase [Candidatus Poribacteria bacterium]|nr:hydroxyacid dehydrogenase [Candidatus Poribacteria bacterium]